jgi:hypothetical protein
MDQVSIKYTIIFHCKTLQNFPNLDFWFENKPSGNPVWGSIGKGCGFDSGPFYIFNNEGQQWKLPLFRVARFFSLQFTKMGKI